MQRTSTPSNSKFIISSASALNMWHCFFFSYFISEPVHCFYLWRMNGVWIIKNTLAVTHSSSTNTRVFILPVKIKLFFLFWYRAWSTSPRVLLFTHICTLSRPSSPLRSHTPGLGEKKKKKKKKKSHPKLAEVTQRGSNFKSQNGLKRKYCPLTYWLCPQESIFSLFLRQGAPLSALRGGLQSPSF